MSDSIANDRLEDYSILTPNLGSISVMEERKFGPGGAAYYKGGSRYKCLDGKVVQTDEWSSLDKFRAGINDHGDQNATPLSGENTNDNVVDS